jgi:hypothetical protein
MTFFTEHWKALIAASAVLAVVVFVLSSAVGIVLGR